MRINKWCFHPPSFSRAARERRLSLAIAALCCLAMPIWGQPTTSELQTNFYHPQYIVPGGLDWHPTITNISKTGSTTTIGWFGVQAPYQVQSCPALGVASNWSSFGPFGGPVNGGTVTATSTGELRFFRVQGAEPGYQGISRCSGCHNNIAGSWSSSRHSTAFRTLKNVNEDTNGQCLVCHTVGYGAPHGFTNEATTPNLANVQCENCHGPGASHRADPDKVVVPVVTPAAEMCGGCHAFGRFPTYTEWKTSAHARVTPRVAAAMLNEGNPRLLSCGPCHSGAVRLALMNQLTAAMSNPLPSQATAADYPVTCTVCHSPHGTGNPGMLRNPLYSTNFFSYNDTTNTTFAAQYNESIQICGQCHNMRGAQWSDTAEPPHYSPQYNLLIGLGGYNNSAPMIGPHGRLNTNQCAQCHVYQHSVAPGTNYMGHTYQVTLNGCTVSGCHSDTANVNARLLTTRSDITNRLQQVKTLLDTWATTKAPAIIRTQYNALAWEYTTPGALGNPAANPSLQGPATALQTNVPPEIKQARFNAYLVLHEGSYGVHNGPYERWLLDTAKTNVQTALNAR